MTVKELIEKLKKFNPEMTVIVWDTYYDRCSKDVYACDASDPCTLGYDNCVLISNDNLDEYIERTEAYMDEHEHDQYTNNSKEGGQVGE